MINVYDHTIIQNIQPHFSHIVNRVCTPSWEISRNSMHMSNMMLIYEGEASFEANGKKFEVTKGYLLYYKPGDIRSAHIHPKKLMKAYAVDFLYTCPVFMDGGWKFFNSELPFDTVQKIHDSYVFTKLMSLFDSLANAWVSGKRNKVALCRTIFIDIIMLILDWKSGYSFDSTKRRRVENVVQYMSEHYHEKLTLKMLAEIGDISPSYLSSIFKEITGTSPINYLMDIRMSRAKTLLLEGTTVSETAEIVGFSDVHYFSRYFKKYEGIYPTQYRHRNSVSS